MHGVRSCELCIRATSLFRILSSMTIDGYNRQINGEGIRVVCVVCCKSNASLPPGTEVLSGIIVVYCGKSQKIDAPCGVICTPSRNIYWYILSGGGVDVFSNHLIYVLVRAVVLVVVVPLVVQIIYGTSCSSVWWRGWQTIDLESILLEVQEFWHGEHFALRTLQFSYYLARL